MTLCRHWSSTLSNQRQLQATFTERTHRPAGQRLSSETPAVSYGEWCTPCVFEYGTLVFIPRSRVKGQLANPGLQGQLANTGLQLVLFAKLLLLLMLLSSATVVVVGEQIH